MWREELLFTLIWRNIRARRTRSLFTIIGIGVSIAIIVAVMTLASDFKKEWCGSIIQTKADLIAVQRGLTGISGSSIDESLIGKIESKYDDVEHATGFLLASLSLSDIQALNIVGVRPEDSDLYIDENQIIEGRFIQREGEIVLGKAAYNISGVEVGEDVRFQMDRKLKLVGIYETGNTYIDNYAIAPLVDVQEMTNRQGKVTMIALYLKPGTKAKGVIYAIEDYRPDLKVMPTPEVMEEAIPLGMEQVDAFTWGLSVIAIAMGVIGTANTMSLSVSERTREIGILMAIGWSRLKILSLILGESLLLSVAGFGIGSLLGIGAVYGITSHPIVSGYIGPSLDTGVFLIALAIALLLGLLGGAYPAYRATRFSPVEALRYE